MTEDEPTIMTEQVQNSTGSHESAVKSALTDAFAPVKQPLDELRPYALELLASESKSGQDIIHYVCNQIGKQIRPALFFMCCRLVNYRGPQYFPMAAVGEFVHNASLLHDDVVDDSPLRRNKPTAHTQWGVESAVLVGDLIYSTASELMAKTGIMGIVSGYAKAIREMSDGELIQLDHLYDLDMDLETYLTIIRFKTSALLGTVCQTAGHLAGCTQNQITALYQYGTAIGTSFQVIDDALDYVSSTRKLGKHSLSDLMGGKVTFPIISLRESATDQEWQFIRTITAQRDPATQDLLKLMQLVEKYDLVTKTLEFARTFTHQAKSALEAFPESPERQDLEKIAHQLLLRTV